MLVLVIILSKHSIFRNHQLLALTANSSDSSWSTWQSLTINIYFTSLVLFFIQLSMIQIRAVKQQDWLVNIYIFCFSCSFWVSTVFFLLSPFRTKHNNGFRDAHLFINCFLKGHFAEINWGLISYAILFSVLVMIAGLFIYPLGFDSKFIRKHCGEGSSMYNCDQCEVGWGLVLAGVGTALAMFCPVLSHYTDMQTTDLLWCQAVCVYYVSLFISQQYLYMFSVCWIVSNQ